MSYREWTELMGKLAHDLPQTESNPGTNSTTTIFDLTTLGIISIAGPDAEKFLQGQLTADVATVDQHQFRLSAVCNPKGRVHSLFTLMKLSNTEEHEYLAITPRELITTTINQLKKYAIFFQTTIEDKSTDWAILGLQSPPTADANTNKAFAVSQWQKGYLLNWPMLHSMIAVLPPEEAIRYCSAIAQPQCKKYDEWLSKEIQAGIGRIYIETQEQLLPHNLDLPVLEAVSFSKGCYTGQEVIARMEYKGKLKSHLYYLTGLINSTPSHTAIPGMELLADEKKVGTVVASAIDDNGIHILAISKDSILSATKIQCNQENAPILHVNEFSNRTSIAKT